jgi:eukaryotic-like serine/threonine-protein kinase
MIGERLGRYRILEELGAGGMGVVYRARDERLDKDVALKMLPPGHLPTAEERERFRREAVLPAALDHPHIAAVFDLASENGRDFVVMEYVPGVTLSDQLADGPLPPDDVVRIGRELAEAVAVAHEHGVLHRDLKPANIRIRPDGRVKVVDFGLAKRIHAAGATSSDSLTQFGSVVGTLDYIAPELLVGGVAGVGSDVYAIGAVLYEAATGARMFPGVSGPALMYSIVHEHPAPPRRVNPALPEPVERVILRAIDKDPAARYASARELLADLDLIAAGQGADVKPPRPRRGWARLVPLALPVVLVAALVGGWWWTHRPPPAPHLPSIVVLPFANLDHDPAHDYIGDGLTEEMIGQLGTIDPAHLHVIGRTTAMQYRNQPLPRIARELNIDYVLEGSVRTGGHQVRIVARLNEAHAQNLLWNQTYDRSDADMLAIQSDVAQSVARELKLKLLPDRQEALQRGATRDPAAHDAYLRGRHAWNLRSADSLASAITYFGRAIATDPGYAKAHEGLAEAWLLMVSFGNVAADSGMQQARAEANRALALDPGLAEAHAVLGSVAEEYNWNWPVALREYQTALRLEPGNATVHQWYAGFLVTLGRLDEALQEIRAARTLDPRSPSINADLGSALYYQRHWDEAIAQYQATIALDSTFTEAQNLLASAWWQKGDPAASITALQAGMIAAGADARDTAAVRRAWSQGGARGFWRWKLARLAEEARAGYVSAYEFAVTQAALGDRDAAFAALDRAVREHSSALTVLAVDPMLDPLRGDPRFAALLRKMNLPAR